jgi:very-short-patch-repair endonuclease/predicted transcriptional regulator of viral defense system
MTRKKLQRGTAELWRLVRRQHGVVARAQLLELGFGSEAIEHRIARGRLHRIWRGVYAVGRPEISREARWTAAVLSCGREALLSHRSAAVLWGLTRKAAGIDVVVPAGVYRRRPGIRVHRRAGLDAKQRRYRAGIPVTDPISTLVDFASVGLDRELERAINEADRLDLVDPEALRAAIESFPRRRGLGRLRRLLGGEPLTDTGLEHLFLAIARAVGLSTPETQVWLNGYRVDFYWPQLGLIVEADGWVYHRTPAEQATDRRRDQVHTTAGLTTLRFAEEQIRYEPDEVRRTLAAVAARLRPQGRPQPSIAAFSRS